MHAAYLIARREYLAYLMSWGFWVSLALAPVFLLLGMGVPALMERVQPSRVFVVLTDEPALSAAIDRALAGNARAATRSALSAMALGLAGDEGLRATRAAFDATPEGDVAGALAALRALSPQPLPSFTPPRPEFVRIGADASFETLRARAAARPRDDAQALYAVVRLSRMPDGAIDAQYWSRNITNDELSSLIERALTQQMRREALTSGGVSPETVARAERLSADVRTFDPARPPAAAGETAREVGIADRMPFLAAFAMSVLLFSAVLGVANMLLMGVIEERSSKALDMLLAVARPIDILIGKFAGVAAVSVTLILAWSLVGLAFVSGLGGAGGAAGGIATNFIAAMSHPSLVLTFLAMFGFGYLMYGSAFLALGSLCETIQEAQTLMTPIILLLLAPMLVLPGAVQNPDSGILKALSWVPPFTPFLFMARAPTGIPAGEIAAALGMMSVTSAIVLWASARVFRAGALRQANAHGWWKALSQVR
jgi:ABC-2 type transport system permease protein